MEKVSIDLTTLDHYAESNDLSNLALIKCDIEKSELFAFRGAEKTLQEYMPIALFECHHEEARQGSVFSFLTELGYDGYFFHNGEKYHYSKFNDFEYPLSDNHRNYIFQRILS